MHPKSIIARFWKKVDTSGGPDACWEWQAAKSAGYGCLRAYGRRGGKQFAHRMSWEIAHGPIPNGMRVCHHCDNPACVNPAHLFLGTAADNTADMMTKGRHRFQPSPGESHPSAKLCEADVIAIRQAFAAGESCPSIAARYGLSRSTVQKVANRKRWGHVP